MDQRSSGSGRVEWGSHVGGTTTAIVSQNLHSDNFGGFGNTVGPRNCDPGAVSPVTITVRILVWAKGLPPPDTLFECRVFDIDASICRVQ